MKAILNILVLTVLITNIATDEVDDFHEGLFSGSEATMNNPAKPIEDDDPIGFYESAYMRSILKRDEEIKDYNSQHYSLRNYDSWRRLHRVDYLTRALGERVNGDIDIEVKKGDIYGMDEEYAVLTNESLDVFLYVRVNDNAEDYQHSYAIDVKFKKHPAHFGLNNEKYESFFKSSEITKKNVDYIYAVSEFIFASLLISDINKANDLNKDDSEAGWIYFPFISKLSTFYDELVIEGTEMELVKIFMYCSLSQYENGELPLYRNLNFYHRKFNKPHPEYDCYIKQIENLFNTGHFGTDSNEFKEDAIAVFKNFSKRLYELNRQTLTGTRGSSIEDVLICAIKPTKNLNESLINWYEYMMIPACTYVVTNNMFTTLSSFENYEVDGFMNNHFYTCFGVLVAYEENKSKMKRILADLNEHYIDENNLKEIHKFKYSQYFVNFFLNTMRNLHTNSCISYQTGVKDLKLITGFKIYDYDIGPFMDFYWELRQSPFSTYDLVIQKDNIRMKVPANMIITKDEINTLEEDRSILKKLTDDKIKKVIENRKNEGKKMKDINFDASKVMVETQTNFSKNFLLLDDNLKNKLIIENYTRNKDYFMKLMERIKDQGCGDDNDFECVYNKLLNFFDRIDEKVVSTLYCFNADYFNELIY